MLCFNAATTRPVFSKRKMLLACGKEQKSGSLSHPGAGAELHDTKPYDAGQGWSVPVTEKESSEIC
jgi:hypothetical protein